MCKACYISILEIKSKHTYTDFTFLDQLQSVLRDAQLAKVIICAEKLAIPIAYQVTVTSWS